MVITALTRNQVVPNGARGFESHRLRSENGLEPFVYAVLSHFLF